MGRLSDLVGEKAHRRTITITTFPVHEGMVLVEGTLVDQRFRENYLVTGEKRPVGEIHHMRILLLVNTVTMRIEDIEADLVEVPHGECVHVKSNLDAIIGEKIAKGFTQRIQTILGKEKSCAHLRTLLLSIASAAVQGIFSIGMQKPFDIRAIVNNPKLEKRLLGTILNTCYVWREDGPEYCKVLDVIDAVRKEALPASNV